MSKWGLSELSVISWVSAVEGCPLSGFLLYFITNIFLEFAENGSIYDYIHKKHNEPTLKQSVLWAKEVTEGKCIIVNVQLLGVTMIICKGGRTGGAREALAPPILDLCTRTLCPDNQLLHSLSQQLPHHISVPLPLTILQHVKLCTMPFFMYS